MTQSLRFKASVRLIVIISLVLVAGLASAQEVLIHFVMFPFQERLKLSKNRRAFLTNKLIDDLPEHIRPKSTPVDEITKAARNFDFKPISVSLFHNRNVLTLSDQESVRAINGFADQQIESTDFLKFADQFIAENQDIVSDAEEILGNPVADFQSLTKVLELADNGLIETTNIDPIQLQKLRILSADFLTKVHARSVPLVDVQVSGFIQLFSKISALMAHSNDSHPDSDDQFCNLIFASRLRMETMSLRKLKCHLKGPNKDTLFLNSSILTNKLIAIMLASSVDPTNFKAEGFLQNLKASPVSFSLYKTSAEDSRVFVDGYFGRELIQICPGRIKKCPLPDFLELINAYFVPEYSQYLVSSLPEDGVLEFTTVLFCLSVVFIIVAVICDCVRRKKETV